MALTSGTKLGPYETQLPPGRKAAGSCLFSGGGAGWTHPAKLRSLFTRAKFYQSQCEWDEE